jgi:hypothetical protein
MMNSQLLAKWNLCIRAKGLLSKNERSEKVLNFDGGMRNICQLIAQQAMAPLFSIFRAPSGLTGIPKHRGRTPDPLGVCTCISSAQKTSLAS